MRSKLAAAVGAVVTVATMLAPAAAAVAKGPPVDLRFLGQAIVPTGTAFQGTTVGGLSSITYDPRRNVFYALSDDPSQFQPARFYTVGLDLGDGRLGDGDVRFEGVTTLLAPDGQPYAPFSLDPEGLALTKDRQLILTSEGFTNSLIDPFVRRYALDGSFLGSLPVPQPFLPTADHSSGIRPNLAFESAGVPRTAGSCSPPPRTRSTRTARPRPSPTAARRGSCVTTCRPAGSTASRVYETDPVARPPVPASQFSVNGLVELLPLNNEFLIAMERSFSVGVAGTGNSIKLYRVALPGATDVNGVDSLAGRLDRVRPAQKTLLLDLDELGIPLDNVEGLTFGPRLPNGRQSVVLVSDNNFAASQFTQFLLFELEN